jgi:tetratricopeptide (TPR) repeat protein
MAISFPFFMTIGWGGNGSDYGYRYLTPALPFLGFGSAALIDRLRFRYSMIIFTLLFLLFSLWQYLQIIQYKIVMEWNHPTFVMSAFQNITPLFSKAPHLLLRSTSWMAIVIFKGLSFADYKDVFFLIGIPLITLVCFFSPLILIPLRNLFAARPHVVKTILWLCVFLTFGIFASISFAFARQDRAKTPEEIYQTYKELTIFDASWGRCEDALRFYGKAKEMREPDPAYKRDFALMLSQQGAMMKKKDLVEKALEVDPASPDAHFALGVLLYFESRFPLALDEFKRVSEINPSYPGVQNNLAAVYERMGEREKALHHLKLSQGLK